MLTPVRRFAPWRATLAREYRTLADGFDAGLRADRVFRLVDGEGSARAAALTRGHDLTKCLVLGRPLPPHHAKVLAAAERAGRLSTALRLLAVELDHAASTRRHLLAKTAYPLLILHLVVPCTSTSLLLSAPGEFFSRTLIAFAALWGILIGTAVVVQTLLRLPRTHAWIFESRLAGAWLRDSENARFLRALALLHGAGVPMLGAFDDAIAAAAAPTPAADHLRARSLLAGGAPLDQAVRALDSLPPMDRSALATAATIGSLEAALTEGAQRCEERAQALASRAATATAALLFLLAAAAAGAALLHFWSGYFAQFDRPRH